MKNEKLKKWLNAEIQSLKDKEIRLEDSENIELKWYILGMRVEAEVILGFIEKEQGMSE